MYDIGLNIHLHSYEYGKGKQIELEKYCKSITYYKRSKSPINLLSSKPFIVKSRSDAKLVKNLIKDDYPILFEGLHTTFPLNDFDFQNRLI
ncbi:MAG TPA: mannosyltransferase, partial [Flavobacteriia bacterium]|nr:mannosyltransferase [Flavobacteriia bacterium]